MEKIKIDYEIEVNVITKAERVLPKGWSYEKSIKKIKSLTSKWKNVTVEFLHELWIAKKVLSSQGARKDLTSGHLSKSWESYCEDIGIVRRTADRWLKRWDEKGMKLIELKEQKKEVKKEGKEYIGGIKEQVEQIEADIQEIEQEIEEEAEEYVGESDLEKQEEILLDHSDEVGDDIKREAKGERKIINEKKERRLNANMGLIQCISRLCYVNTAMDDLSKLWPDLKDTAKKNFIISFDILKEIIIKEKIKC